MLTICRGEPEDYNQASEFMDVAIEDIEKFDNYFNVLRRDIYLLVNKKVHETMNLSRVEFFKQIKYKTKINKNLINDFVNASLVESHLDIIQGTVPLDVLLALRFKANKADWEEIYRRAVGDKEKNIRELKQKQKVRISRYRTRHIKRMSLNLVPTITSITKSISYYYKDNNNIKPKKASTYEYWDEVRIKNNISMDGDDIIFI